MNMKKIMTLACMALALFTAGTSMADDNTGSGGVIMYTDSNGLNPTNTPYAGGYVVHTFTSSDTLNIPVPASADVLVVVVVATVMGAGGKPAAAVVAVLFTTVAGRLRLVRIPSLSVAAGTRARMGPTLSSTTSRPRAAEREPSPPAAAVPAVRVEAVLIAKRRAGPQRRPTAEAERGTAMPAERLRRLPEAAVAAERAARAAHLDLAATEGISRGSRASAARVATMAAAEELSTHTPAVRAAVGMEATPQRPASMVPVAVGVAVMAVARQALRAARAS
jgi:hypothetical protein